MSMTAVQQWALELANQIKSIQTSWADDEIKVRQDMIEQELERALTRVSSHEREEKIAALRAHFPIPDGGEVRVIEVTKEAAPRQVTVEEALELLVKAAPQLSESQRRTYSERLASVGYRILELRSEPAPVAAPQPVGGGIERLPDALGRKLGLRTEAKVYPTQVFNVLHELVDCVLALSGAASQVVTELRRRAGEPPGNREDDLKAILAQYLTDQPGGSADRMRLVVSRTRTRLAGFLQVPAELPRDLCSRATTIDPETIVDVIKREKDPGFMANTHKMYWERFAILWKRDQWASVDGSPVWEKKAAQSVLGTVEQER